MNAGERNLLEPRRRDARDFPDDVVNRNAAARSARRGNDAVAAALLAAGLDAQRERRAAGDARLDRGPARPAALAESCAGRQLARIREQADDLQLLVVGDDTNHAGQRFDVAGAPCGIAAGDNDSRGRVLAGDAPDRLPCALVCGGGHRAGVDDHDVRSARGGFRAAAGAELLFQAQRVGLVHPASERDDRVLHPCCSRAAACSTLSASFLLYCVRRSASDGSPSASICTASTPALVAPGLPIDTVATGTPGGI